VSEPTFEWVNLGPGSLLDQAKCSCGWESQTYFDGQEYAHADWVRHAKAAHHTNPLSPQEQT
jgi:hypothetical protein